MATGYFIGHYIYRTSPTLQKVLLNGISPESLGVLHLEVVGVSKWVRESFQEDSELEGRIFLKFKFMSFIL